jgi:protein-L-isoaspartate O-methyltransferase
MNPFHRLHTLRMENDAVKFAMDEQRPRFERMATRHENGTAPRAVSAYQLFQTPPELAARLVALLNLKPGQRVLEPSAGLGRLIEAIDDAQPRCPVVAVEVAAQLAAELFQKYQSGVTLKQRDFLTTQPAELGEFDAVAMNPPFHMRADIRHILHARTFLKPGGKLAALCLDTPHRSAALRGLCDHWEQIPAGTFRGEGTNVPTVLLRLTA